MTIDPTSTTAASATAASSGVTGQKSNAMGQDAFMQLLVTQLEHQDPTAPQDDSQFIAQLAQFSSLEKLTNMDKTLASINALLSSIPPAPASTTNSGMPTASTGATTQAPADQTTTAMPVPKASATGTLALEGKE